MAKFGDGLLVVVFYSLIFNNGAEGFHGVCPQSQSLSADPDEVTQTLRTGYHFQPPKNWINDPNGPMYYKGLYHFFYQHNPEGAFWGNIIWAHSVSKDLVNWVALKPALYPSKPYDESGCWSGSITIVPGKGPVILYTGYDSRQRQVQAYAIPKNASDPLLRDWVKPDNNPIIKPGTDIDPTAFRDPTTGWRNRVDGYWRILVGGKRNRNSKRGLALLYKSKDFVKWTGSKHPLHSAATGIWECPDFFPVIGERTGLDTSEIGGHVRHVLKVSLLSTAYDVYTIGKYDPYTDRYVPYNTSSDGWDGLRYDYGKFYASKTFFDGRKKRRVLWGWVNESDTHQNDVAKGWAGIQAIPRSVWLDRNGKQLVQWPITELEKLRGDKVEVKNKKLVKGQNVEIIGITAAQADVEVTFSILGLEKAEELDPKWVNPADLCAHKGSKVGGGVGPFGLLTLASQNLEEFTPVFFIIFKAQHSKHRVLMCSDATSSSLKSGLYKPSFAGFVDVDIAADRKLSLRSLIDHSVVESFGAGGKTCITSRVYPTLAVGDGARLYAFNDGSEIVTVDHLNAWSMKSPRLMNQNKIH